MDRRSFLNNAAAGIALGAVPAAQAATAEQADALTDDGEGGKMSAIRQAAMTLPRIDTHSHYAADFGALRDQYRTIEDLSSHGIMSYLRQLAEGSKVLYGVDPGLFLDQSAPEELLEKADALRAQGPAKALEVAMDADNIKIQFLFCGVRPDPNDQLRRSPRVRLLAYIDDAVAGVSRAFCPDERGKPFNYYDALCAQFGELQTLDDYVGQFEPIIAAWRSQNVVGMKVGLAYTTGLSFGNPTLDEAKTAFGKKRDMNPSEIKTVQDCAFRHALLACQRHHVPVVVHTGFQIWGHANLEQSNPMLLHNLLIDPELQDLQWVLLHGGNPYVGETTYLARMFPNVTIDFTWISWMTRARFTMALAEWLEIVPHSRFCWGSDSGRPENIVGIGRITREVIANVLEEQIALRVINEKIAHRFLELCFEENPRRIFQLEA